MKSLIRHYLRSNIDEVLRRSIMHCHANFVHSVMLMEKPGSTIRMFIAEPGHDLHCNDISRFRTDQTVGFHAHHCDLTLIPLVGKVNNFKVSLSPRPDFECMEFDYQSAITHGKIGFKLNGNRGLQIDSVRLLEEGEFMSASQMHTISTFDDWAAWLAIEGKEDPNYNGKCYSTQRLDQQDFSGLYKPMSPFELDRLLGGIALSL